MKCLRAGASVEESGLLAKVTLSVEFDGKPVDVVETFGSSMGAWTVASALVHTGLGYLKELPDLVVGLPAEELVTLSTEELAAFQDEYRANASVVSFTLQLVGECLHAIAQVAEEHPETCGIDEEFGEKVRQWVDDYSDIMGPHTLRFPPTKATRIQDLKFILVYMCRLAGETKGVRTFTTPTLQQCNPDAVSADPWHEVRAALDEAEEELVDPNNDVAMILEFARPWEEYKRKMGDLAVPYRHRAE